MQLHEQEHQYMCAAYNVSVGFCEKPYLQLWRSYVQLIALSFLWWGGDFCDSLLIGNSGSPWQEILVGWITH